MPSRSNSRLANSRYYFNVDNGGVQFDHEGMELPDLAAIRTIAIRLSGDILRDGAAESLWAGVPWRLWVTSAEGDTLFTLVFSALSGAER